MFPDRTNYIFNNIPKNKRVPIHHLTDLSHKDLVVSIRDKRLLTTIKKWHTEHIKEFKRNTIDTVITKDANLISVVNYNVVKDLYRYKTSPLMHFYKFSNTYKTVSDTVKYLTNLDRENINIVRVNIPITMPSYNIVQKFTTFSDTKYTKIVTDNNLKVITELYKWLEDSTRPKSVFSSIDDDDSNTVYLEFQYKGYVSYLRLGLLRELSKQSNLESKQKIDSKKVQKLLVLVIFKIQKTVEGILQGTIEAPTTSHLDINNSGIEMTEVPEEDEDYVESDSATDRQAQDNKTKLQLKENTDKGGDYVLRELNENVFSRLDKELDDLLNTGVYADSMYEEDILKDLDSKGREKQAFTAEIDPQEITAVIQDNTLDSEFSKYKTKAKEFKNVSTVELKNNEKLYEKRKLLKSPYDPSTPIDTYKVVTKEDIEIKPEERQINVKAPTITKEVAQESINVYDKKYISKVLKKDIVACVTNLEKVGILISNHEVQEVKDAMGNYEIHRLSLKPIDGKENTLTFKIPSIDDEGEYYATGIKSRLRKVRTDLPIRKIDPYTVALTSGYGKLFVSRSQKVAYDDCGYIVKFIKNSYLDKEGIVKDITPGNCYSNKVKKPNILSKLSMEFKQFVVGDYNIVLDKDLLDGYFKQEHIEELLKENLYPCGYRESDKKLIVCDMSEKLYIENTLLGTINDLLQIEDSRVPKTFTNVKILGDDIPLGVVLSYYMGLDKFLAYLKQDTTIVDAANRATGDIVIKFEDKKVIVNKPSQEAKLLLNGFNYFRDIIKKFTIEEFTIPSVYYNLFEFRGFGLKHLNELDLLKALFIDPITKEVLTSINEPDNFIPLLFRANELLEDFIHPDVNDPAYSRIRGYERMPTMLYKCLAESVRSYKLRFNKSNKIELDPYKVWNTITMDNSKKLSEDLNPVLDLKENEIVTLTGGDALSKGAIPKFLRRYHENDMGLISEATVDSSDTAVNIYLTPYAKLKNARGLVDVEDTSHKEDPARIFSTSALLAPMAEYDDPKRVNFINIQNGHTIFSHGYKQSLVRTGYEYIVPYRVGKLYCTVAKQDGVVLTVTTKKMTVKYNDNTTESIQLGSRYGQMEGTIYPHELITNLVPNQKFKKDDYLAYNANFFEPDWLDKKRLVMKFSKTVTTALAITNEVFEDSSSISENLSSQMTTEVIKDKTFIIDFKKNIIGLKPVGSYVDANDTLFTIVDETTDYTNLSESSIELLKSLSQLSPKAKTQGIIDRYEVKYNGDISDMSETLQKLCSKKDEEVKHDTKGTFYSIENNRVTSDYRVGNVSLNVDQIALTVYIRVKLKQAIGD
jgi:hypothetical protein